MSSRVSRALASHALASLALSMPWPLLLLLVWRSSGSEAWLGLAAAARMAPYVALSWWVARLANRMRRDLLVRATLVARTVLLTGVAVAVSAGHTGTALGLATLAVAVATPAYPALAAAMPRLAGTDSRRATDLLVTIEVASFVVGPAMGGLLLAVPWLVGPVSVAGSALAVALYAGIQQPRPTTDIAIVPTARRSSDIEVVAARTTGGSRLALGALVAANLVVAATGMTLLPLAERVWVGGTSGWSDASAYGFATGALGFGALAGPLLGGPLRRTGDRSIAARMRRGLVCAAVALALAGVAPSVLWVALPLLLVGAAAVSVEASATQLLQEAVPDHRRAGVLGLADSAMVLAALVGALVAPPLAGWWGPQTLLWVLATGCLTAGVLITHGARQSPRARIPSKRHGSHPHRVTAARLAQPPATTAPRSTTAVGSRSTERSSIGLRG